MLRKLIAVSMLLVPFPAFASMPLLNATCGGVEVHADAGGPVLINGRVADLKKVSDTYYEARLGGVLVSLEINPDGSPSLSATGTGAADDACEVASTVKAGKSGG
jgi:hypothetical protein